MFDLFLAAMNPTTESFGTPREALEPDPGFEQLMSDYSGVTFNYGLYRLHNEESGAAADRYISDAFPVIGPRCHCFGFDWLGRQFALDRDRIGANGPKVLMLDNGIGEALEIPASFTSFHQQEMIDYADACLASEFYRLWAREHSKALPLAFDSCVSYAVPLYLGGSDDIQNLEVANLADEWNTTGELVKHLPS